MVDGVVIPVNNCSCITVDFWGQTDCNILAAFLTHAHADHVQGLKESWNGERGAPKTVKPWHLALQGWCFRRKPLIMELMDMCRGGAYLLLLRNEQDRT